MLEIESDEDDTLSSSSTATYESQARQCDKLSARDTGLEQCLDSLSEKRRSTRELALLSIIDAFTNKLQHQFVEKNCITLLQQCLSSIKKGSSKEISLACRVIGLLTITVGSRDNAAHEILEYSIPSLSQALRSGADSLKISSSLPIHDKLDDTIATKSWSPTEAPSAAITAAKSWSLEVTAAIPAAGSDRCEILVAGRRPLQILVAGRRPLLSPLQVVIVAKTRSPGGDHCYHRRRF
uniref:Interferon-related developmental regulator N-terminal domain-containing protein n=1 Tax=Nelumbo nucifera TaxID=4432 RepID=A0A822XNQ9_NELNU|nr:TPA_asm: hypothetical protein HUJ06_022796 [Nelumbo nucifera]